MILRLVERRTGSRTAGNDWFAPQSRMGMLTALVAPLGLPDWAVDLVLVDDQTMAGLNDGYRQVAGVTDVLSFSYLADTGEGLPDLPRGTGCARSDLWLDPLASTPDDRSAQAMGEVVLAPAFVADRCREKGWPVDHEMPLLVVHGIMHILGWDHGSDEQAEAMQAVEQEILAVAGLPHPLRERS